MNVSEYAYIEGEWVNSVLSAFESLGLDIEVVTDGIDEIENNRLKSDQRLEVSKLRTIWHRAEHLAKTPLLGVKVGVSLSPRALGVLAPVMWHSPTLRSLIENIQKFQVLISENGVFQSSEVLVNGSAFLYCKYKITETSVPVNCQQVMAILTSVVINVRELTSGVVEVAMISVSSKLDQTQISKALNVKVMADQPSFGVYFNIGDLDKVCEGVNDKLYQLNLAYAEELLRVKNNANTFFNSIKHLIKLGGYSVATIEFVESELGINRRAIQRRLAKRGTNFRQLKEEVLKETAAIQLLCQSMNMVELSAYLGYSEPSAFYRAFKGWYNVAPRAFYHMRQFKPNS